MDGRWKIRRVQTLYYGDHDEILGEDRDDAPTSHTPVVPCDDAAIERAAERFRLVAAPWLDDMGDTALMAFMESAFGAAGETDR